MSKSVELPPHAKDHEHPVPWKELMELERINDNTFRSTCRAFEPSAGIEGYSKQAYGGHVYAQAVWAAAQTVDRGLVCHSVTGFFTLHASSKLPFIFSVKRVRNGRSFAVRTVEVTQVAVDGVCFTSTMSFKRAEASDIEFQRPIKFQEHYAEAFKGRSAAQLPRSAGSEHPLMLQFKLGFYGPPFPGLVSKTLETDKDYNKERHPLDRRALSCFQVIGDMPPYDEAPNLHIAGYLYASDRNSLFSVARHLGVDENYGKMASLSHSVTLHNVGEAMSLVDRSGKPRWLYQEAWTDRMGDGRGVHQSRMYTDTDMHVATTLQDGLIRLQFDPEEDEKRERQRNLEEMQKRKVKL